MLDADWADAAESFAALGQPVRLRLLREILGGRCTAAELTGSTARARPARSTTTCGS